MDNPGGMVNEPRRFSFGRWLARYGVSAIVALLLYIVSLAVYISVSDPQAAKPGFLFGIGFAIVFSLLGGFALAFLLMLVPWAIAAWIQLKTRWNGRIYFPAAGALLVFILGCAAASISPKPLFVDEQTFWEGALLTAQREGLALLIAGIAFGVCYGWLERRSQPIR
jgi:hypothetical protein